MFIKLKGFQVSMVFLCFLIASYHGRPYHVLESMVNYYHGMKSKHVMGLYGDTERHFSRRMKINVRMLEHQSRNVNLNEGQVRAIMPFLHEEIVQYVEEMDPLPRYVSINATTYPRKT